MITIIDSGVGGLSILRAIRRELPHAPILYYGDTAFMPYGNKTPQEIYHRLKKIIQNYEEQTDLYVVACNSATVSIMQDYRQWSRHPFIGVEPGIKPAAAVSKKKSIAVLATPRTVQSPQIPRLIKQYGRGYTFHLIACPDLAEAIERQPAAIEPALACLQAIPVDVDVVVLACTHYPLILKQIQNRLGEDKIIIDVSAAVARQAAKVYNALPQILSQKNRAQDGTIKFECSGEHAAFLRRIAELLPTIH